MPAARLSRTARVATVAALLGLVGAMVVPGPAAATPTTAPTAAPTTGAAPMTGAAPTTRALREPCDTATAPGDARCLVVERDTPSTPRASGDASPQAATPSGITPTQLQNAYGVAGRTAPDGTTVGIVVAYDAPNVEADLASYRSYWGLPACTTANGCFRKVDQRGATVPPGGTTSTAPTRGSAGWQLETTLDTQAVSAMCPSCDIVLVEADSANLDSALGPALLRAQTLGATVIGNSFGAGEYSSMTSTQSNYWAKATVPVFVATGDDAWNNLALPATDPAYNLASYPATSPTVVAVGGTSATLSGSTLGTESAWTGAGSGCSFSFARPASQAAYFTATGTTPDTASACGSGSTAKRAEADVAAIADPYAPGFPVLQGSSWSVAGGTSLAAQLVAAQAAYAGPRQTGSSVTDVAYRLAAANAPAGLADVTSGSNNPSGVSCGSQRICNARTGWDGPTGLGAPRGLSVFAPLLTAPSGVFSTGDQVTLSGANLVPQENAVLTSGSTTLASVVVGSGGTWSVNLVVPPASAAALPITVTGSTSGLTATSSLSIGLTATASPLAPGQRFGLTAFGMTPNERVTFTAAGNTAVTVVAGSDGTARTGTTSFAVSSTTSATGIAVSAAGGTSGLQRSGTLPVPAARLTVSPTSAAPGASVTVTGAYFPVGSAVSFSGAAGPSGPTTVGSDGTFSAAVTLPVTASGSVTVTASAGGRQASASVTIPAATLTVSPTSAAPGASVTVTGAYFPVGSAVSFSGAAGPSGPTTVGSDGTFSAAVTLPVTASGSATVTASAGGRQASASVTIPAATLTVLPTSAAPGASVMVTGAFFPVGSTVSFSGAAGPSGPTTVGSDGTFSATVTLPDTASGSAAVTASAGGLQATATVTIPDATITPPFQRVTAGGSATVQVTGFAVGELLTLVSTAGGTPVSANANPDGTATITWTPDGTTYRTAAITVTGARSGRSVSTLLDLVSATTPTPDVPTVLSVVPTTAGDVQVGIRTAATGPAPTRVSVLTSTNQFAMLTTSGGDVFVTVPSVPGGTTLTVQALAGNAAGDSALSGASLPVTANTSSGTGDLTPVGPVRLLDTRADNTPLGAGKSTSFRVAGRAGVPAAGVGSVVLSLTVVTPTANTYVTLWPTGEAQPLVSNANVGPGLTKTSLVKVRLGAGGMVSIYNNVGTTPYIVDVVGFYAAGPTSAGTQPVFAHNASYAGVTPATRLLDTRGMASSPLRTAGGSIVVPVRGLGGVPADATGVELAVQGVDATAQGYLTVYPTGTPQPLVSQVQFDLGRPAVTSVVATLGANGSVTVYTSQPTEVIVDVIGYYSPSATGRFVAVSPRRYLDTRSTGPIGNGQPGSAPLGSVRIAGGTAVDRSQQVPSSATAVVFSLTSTDNTARTYVTAWPSGAAQPYVTSLLPDPANGIYDNLVLSATGTNGAVSFYDNAGTVNLIVDVQGYYTTSP